MHFLPLQKLLSYDCILYFILNIIFFDEYTQYYIKVKSNLYIDLYDIQWIRYSGIIENCSKLILECPTFEFLGQETGN